MLELAAAGTSLHGMDFACSQDDFATGIFELPADSRWLQPGSCVDLGSPSCTRSPSSHCLAHAKEKENLTAEPQHPGSCFEFPVLHELAEDQSCAVSQNDVFASANPRDNLVRAQPRPLRQRAEKDPRCLIKQRRTKVNPQLYRENLPQVWDESPRCASALSDVSLPSPRKPSDMVSPAAVLRAALVLDECDGEELPESPLCCQSSVVSRGPSPPIPEDLVEFNSADEEFLSATNMVRCSLAPRTPTPLETAHFLEKELEFSSGRKCEWRSTAWRSPLSYSRSDQLPCIASAKSEGREANANLSQQPVDRSIERDVQGYQQSLLPLRLDSCNADATGLSASVGLVQPDESEVVPVRSERSFVRPKAPLYVRMQSQYEAHAQEQFAAAKEQRLLGRMSHNPRFKGVVPLPRKRKDCKARKLQRMKSIP
eukprot:TRINITY_DN3593_c1_g1_i1.p1 TRINITY_DN3593_c1_g1~~TRINITY_DN3593_c1_g1_i1.p1  ORF type:complete len:427 (+),score=53.62 TRINITY_DN3593_c1_g1_i1:48-1328(+)